MFPCTQRVSLGRVAYPTDSTQHTRGSTHAALGDWGGPVSGAPEPGPCRQGCHSAGFRFPCEPREQRVAVQSKGELEVALPLFPVC